MNGISQPPNNYYIDPNMDLPTPPENYINKKIAELLKQYEHRDTEMMSLYYAEQCMREIVQNLMEDMRGRIEKDIEDLKYKSSQDRFEEGFNNGVHESIDKMTALLNHYTPLTKNIKE